MAHLSEQQLKFCALYAGGKTQVAAYMEAYDITSPEKKHAAENAASRLLQKPEIRQCVKECQKIAFENLALTTEKVALKLAEMAFAEKDDEVYNTSVQLKALDLLQKQMGLQKQKVDTNVNQTLEITVSIED